MVKPLELRPVRHEHDRLKLKYGLVKTNQMTPNSRGLLVTIEQLFILQAMYYHPHPDYIYFQSICISC